MVVVDLLGGKTTKAFSPGFIRPYSLLAMLAISDGEFIAFTCFCRAWLEASIAFTLATVLLTC